MPISIIWPKPTSITSPLVRVAVVTPDTEFGIIVASGRASDDSKQKRIVAIRGTCTVDAGKTTQFTSIAHHRGKMKKQEIVGFHQWMIPLSFPRKKGETLGAKGTKYTCNLVLEAVDEDFKLTSVSQVVLKFDFQFWDSKDPNLHVYARSKTRKTKRPKLSSPLIGILGPGIAMPNTTGDISPQADDFIAYGPLNPYPLGSVTMTDLNNTVIEPVYTFSDPTDLQFWCAQFPSLPSQTYVLYVEDIAGSFETLGPLTV